MLYTTPRQFSILILDFRLNQKLVLSEVEGSVFKI